MDDLEQVRYNNQLILTTEQLAEFYGTSVKRITDNFNENRDRFESGVHYYHLEGDQLKAFKDETRNSGLVGLRASSINLWTRRGAGRHSKMLGTDRAWDMFDELEETYFNPQKRLPSSPEEILALLVKNGSSANKKIDRISKRVDHIENDARIDSTEYSYLGKRVARVVEEYIDAHHMHLSNLQRGELYRDISAGMNKVTGVKARTQIKRKDFYKADRFISDWVPSTATLSIIRNSQEESE